MWNEKFEKKHTKTSPKMFKPFSQEPKKNPKAKKSHEQRQRIFWTIRGAYRSLPIKTRFWGKSHQKVHPKVRRNLCRNSSLGYLFCPWFSAAQKFFHCHFVTVLHPQVQTQFSDFFSQRESAGMATLTLWCSNLPRDEYSKMVGEMPTKTHGLSLQLGGGCQRTTGLGRLLRPVSTARLEC